MVLVAVVAVLIWAWRDLPEIIDRANLYHGQAVTHSAIEKGFREQQRERIARVSRLRAELNQRNREPGSSDPLTERYLALPLRAATDDVTYYGEMADYHNALEQKYRRAVWSPWDKAPPDPNPPRDPYWWRVLKIEAGEVLEPIAGGTSVAFAPDGSGLVVGCRDHTIKVLSVPSRRVLSTLPFPSSQVFGVDTAFSPDGKTIFALGYRQPVWRWDFATHHALPAIPWDDAPPGQPDREISASSLACAPDGGTIAIGGGGSVPTRRPSAVNSGPSPAKPRTEIHFVRLINARTGAPSWDYQEAGDWINKVVFSPDGTLLACAAGSVLLLDARTGTLKATLKPVRGYVLAAAFSPDGRTVAGAGSSTVETGGFSGQGRVTLWDVSSGKILRTLDGPTGRAQAVAFSPDGRTIAAAGTGPSDSEMLTLNGSRNPKKGSEVRLWEVATGKMGWTTKGETDAAFSLAFSPDGKSLAFCDQDYVYLLDAATGRLKQIVMETIRKARKLDPSPAKASKATRKP